MNLIPFGSRHYTPLVSNYTEVIYRIPFDRPEMFVKIGFIWIIELYTKS